MKVALIFDHKVRPDTTGVYCRRALGELADVEHFVPGELGRVPRQGFDLYLNIDDGLEYYLPDDLHPCAWWAIDTHLNYDWCLQRARTFDFVFTAQRDGAVGFQRDGIPGASWLPLACDPEVHRKHDVAKEHDVCFVGNLFDGPRGDLVRLIQQHFPRSFVGQRFFDEMAQTYSASRLVFNRSIRNDVNMRVFEAMSCGSLLISNDLADNGQAELARDGLHLVTYREAEELLDKLRFYLARPEMRERIAAAGRQHALASHTYGHRMAALLQHVVAESSKKTSVATINNGFVAMSPDPILEQVPANAQRLLIICWRGDSRPDQIKARCPQAEVLVLAGADSAWARQIDTLYRETTPRERWDAIVLLDVLEALTDARAWLNRVRDWLASGGQLLATVANLRHHSTVRALLEGNWSHANGTAGDWRPIPRYTRRELEKLLHRAGWGPVALTPLPNSEQRAWHEQGRPGRINIGALCIQGINATESEEYYVAHYLVRAVPRVLPERGLTSIVILTHNQLLYTQACVASILAHTDVPYELIFVDNASTDGTVDYLRSIPGAKLIVNATNRGFPAGCNQGIQAAKGTQIVLLNNDTVVTTGWLDRLLRTLDSDPRIGLVGPMSNNVSGEQRIAVTYDDLANLDGFAWEWGKANDGKHADTDRLVGFCLLIRQAAIERIGLLDEQYGIGCWDDDDYTKSALAAGYRAVIARDAFVHHVGGRTFLGMNVDYESLMKQNQLLFEKKWQNQATHPASGAIKSSPSSQKENIPMKSPAFQLERGSKGGLLLRRKKILLSLCMIVRNNASTIEAAIASMKPWVDEIIVVDTGSTDETPHIAERLGARVFHIEWPDSFSAARNESLKHARGEWIVWIDSDDTISSDNGRKLRQLVEGPHEPSILGYVMQVHCPGPGETGDLHMTVVDHVKVFRNRPDLRFSGRIHEQILPAIGDANGFVGWTDIFVRHSGYDHSPEGQARKLKRDLYLLDLELKDQPNHPFTLFNLGMTYADIRKFPEAIDFLRRSIQYSSERASHLGKAYALLVHAQVQHDGPTAALETCVAALKRFPDDLELRFHKAILLHDLKRWPEAVATYRELLANQGKRHATSIDQGIRSFKARQNLAVVYGDMGDWAAAADQWRQVVAEVPDYAPGWRGLGEAYLYRDDAHAAQQLIAAMEQHGNLESEVQLLRSRIAATMGNAIEARRHLAEARRLAPDDADLLRLWCQLLFEQADWIAAEQAVAEVIRRDPLDGAAHHNLGTVLLRRSKITQAIQTLQESLRLRPDYPDTYRQLARAHNAVGQLSEARQAWSRVLHWAPNDPEAQSGLRSAGKPVAMR